jgi:tRNA G18 (ribose-2'-O)-methylase SpoU
MIDRLTPIHDREDPRVACYLNQKDAWLRAAHNPEAFAGTTGTPGGDGVFMAEGSLVIEHLLQSAYPVESVLVAEGRAGALAGLLGRVPDGVPMYVASRGVMESIVGFDVHRGLLAVGRRPAPRDPAELARRCRALVVLEDLSNHDNLGSVFRSAAVLGGTGMGVLLSPRCCDPLYRKALRVSMGHALRIPFAVVDDWPGGLEGVAAQGFELIALDPAPDAERIDRVEIPARPALILGAEGPGLSPRVRAMAHRRVVIPQAPGTDSLNIGVAAGVALHRLVPAGG